MAAGRFRIRPRRTSASAFIAPTAPCREIRIRIDAPIMTAQTVANSMKTFRLIFALTFLAGGCLSASAQQRGFPVNTNDESGFVRIFDGKSLAGWQGDTNHWRVEDGCLVGEVT